MDDCLSRRYEIAYFVWQTVAKIFNLFTCNILVKTTSPWPTRTWLCSVTQRYTYLQFLQYFNTHIEYYITCQYQVKGVMMLHWLNYGFGRGAFVNTTIIVVHADLRFSQVQEAQYHKYLWQCKPSVISCC